MQRRPLSYAAEWIEDLDFQLFEIRFVPCGDSEAVDAGSSGDHGILDQLVRCSFHQAAPFAKTECIHRKNSIGLRRLLDPDLYLGGFAWVVSPGALHPCNSPMVTAGRNS